MDMLFIAEAIVYSDISYRLRVMKQMKAVPEGTRPYLFIFGVAPSGRWSNVHEDFSSAGLCLLRSISLPRVKGIYPLEFILTLILAWIFLVLQLFRGRRFRLIQVENLVASLSVLPFLCFFRRIPVILDYHGVVPEEVKLRHPGRSRLIYPILKWLERMCLARVAGMVVPSESFREHVIGSFSIGRERVLVSPNRIDPGDFRASEGRRSEARRRLGLEDRLVLAYSGGAAPYQEPRLMVESFRELFYRDRRFFFLCLTQSPEEFTRLFREAGLPDGAFRVLSVAHREVGDYLQAGDLAFLLRTDTLVNRVSSPTKFMEYLASGVPLLATPWAGDASEQVARYDLGIVVHDYRIDGIVGAVEGFFGRSLEEREGQRARCREMAVKGISSGDGQEPVRKFYGKFIQHIGRDAPEDLNVLMVTMAFLPDGGGVQRHIFEVSRELMAMGNRVTVVTGGLERGLPPIEVMEGIRVVRLREERGGRIPAWWRVRNWGQLWRHRELIRRASVVHLHDYQAFVRWYLPFRFLFPFKPVYITFHGYEDYPLSRRVRWIRRAVNRLCSGSIGVGNFIAKYYGTPCDEFVLGGVRVEKDGSVGEEGRKGAVYLGRLDRDMSIDRYLVLLVLLGARFGIELDLEVLGDGPMKAVLEQEAREKKLRVVFRGWVEDPRPFLERALLAFADSYLSILEAMACRTPVFSISKNPLKRDYLEEIQHEGELITIRDDPDSLAHDVFCYLSDPERYAERLERAYAFASTHTWREIARIYLRLYG